MDVCPKHKQLENGNNCLNLFSLSVMMHMLFLYIKFPRYFRYALSRPRPNNLLIYQQFYLKYSIPLEKNRNYVCL